MPIKLKGIFKSQHYLVDGTSLSSTIRKVHNTLMVTHYYAKLQEVKKQIQNEDVRMDDRDDDKEQNQKKKTKKQKGMNATLEARGTTN